MSPVDPCDPVEAYVRSIRSVLFIDDQFPTFADVSSTAFEEAERARGLWRACTQKGWLCDIDNSPDWTSPERRQRLASCDLLILDLHLAGQDSRPALSIVRELACSETPNLVVVYTADPKLDQAFITVAASARGVSTAALASELEPEIESMEVHWTQDDILAFIAGQPRWMRTYTAACKMASLPVARPIGEVLLERWIATNLGVSPHESLRSIERIGRAESRWFQCGNLFVVVIGKPPEQVPEEEARVVLNGLEAAIKDWAPPWLACLVASSRRSVETGSFRDDADLPPEPLQDGLIRYIRASDDGEERARRAREITAHMLARRFDVAINSMSEQLLQRTEIDSAQPPTTHEDQAQLLHLNAFLCSEPFSRHHLRVGTIFRAEDEYWVCVTPACDMVPRSRRRSIDPWAVELDPLRPMLALRLERRRGDEISVALADAEKGRYLFFWDLEEEKGTPIVAACFNTFTGDPNPRLEQMFALDRASVRNGKASLQRCARDQQSNTTIALRNVDCRVVYQLRTPYAERLAHVVGHHLSRIGVNFLQFGTQDPEGQDRPPYRPVDQSPV